MPIRHQYVMTGSDPTDSSVVGTTKWNQDHTAPEIADVTGLVSALAGKSDTDHTHPPSGGAAAFREFGLISAAVVFTNLPAGLTEASGQQSRTRVDLSGFTDFRVLFCMSVAAVAGDVKLQYSTTSNFASPVDLIQSDNPGANALIESAWTTIPAGAKADVYLRVCMINGNGNEDPGIRWYRLQVR
jgi:hypothetical protein